MLSPALHRSPLQFSALNASTEFATPPFFALLWNDVGTICLTGQMVDGRKERHLSFLLIFLHSDSRAVKCRRQSFQVPSCQAIPSTTTCFTGTNSEYLLGAGMCLAVEPKADQRQATICPKTTNQAIVQTTAESNGRSRSSCLIRRERKKLSTGKVKSR